MEFMSSLCMKSSCNQLNIKSRKGDIPMSIIGVMHCKDGLVIFSDTRRTLRREGEKNQYFDDEQKIFSLEQKPIFFGLTGSSRFGDNKDIPFMDIMRLVKATTHREITVHLSEILSEVGVNSGCVVSVIEPYFENNHCFAKVAFVNGKNHNCTAEETVICTSNTKTWFQSDNLGVLIGSSFELKCSRIADAYDIVVPTMKDIIHFYKKFHYNHQFVGGDIDIVTVSVSEIGIHANHRRIPLEHSHA